MNIQAQIEDQNHLVDSIVDSSGTTNFGIPAYAMTGGWYVGIAQNGLPNLVLQGGFYISPTPLFTITMRRPNQTTYIVAVGTNPADFWWSRPTR